MKFEVLIRNNKDKFVNFRYVVNSINELDVVLNSFRDLDVSKYHIEIKTISEEGK